MVNKFTLMSLWIFQKQNKNKKKMFCYFWQKFHRWVLMNIQGDPVKIFHKTKIQPNASTHVGTK